MLIPFGGKERDEKVAWVLSQCKETMRHRAALYDVRKRYFYFGCLEGDRTLYNRLQAHIDLVSSFLYSADRVRFTVAAPRNSEKMIVQQCQAIEEEWNDEFRDSGISYQFSEALLWSLIFDSMFLKLGWNEARGELFAHMVQPQDFGVFNEAEVELESQEAFCHTYLLDWDNAAARLARAGLRDKIPKMATVFQEGAQTMPAPLTNMLSVTANAGPSMTGRLVGNASQNYMLRSTYEPATTNPMVEWSELYVWDDVAKDYRIITIADPDIVVSDSAQYIDAAERATKNRVSYGSRSNTFLPGEHPFVHICPFAALNYFWGKSHTDDLMNLQDWSSQTLDNIREILEQQVDPAKVFSGFMGLQDEKASALGGPGSWVIDQMPGAKVDRLIPEMPPDLFANFQSIGQIFLEASGLTETVTGKGEQGVRGRGHARQLVTTGSGRIRKVAVNLEGPLVRLGDIALKLMKRNDDEPLRIDSPDGKGMEFLLSNVETRWKMRVAGHSHSPLFSDESRELAIILLKARAIDREMFVKMLAPPNEAAIIHALREAAPKEAKMQMLQLAAGKGGQKKAA